MHINCDMGEGYGSYTIHDDKSIMPYINACNIACGYHAGDATTMRRTIEIAVSYGLEIGAHPSYPDRQGFGRRYMKINPKELTDMLCFQIGAISGMTAALGGIVSHIKPHGALYNSAVINEGDAHAIIDAILLMNQNLTLYTLPNGCLFHLAKANDIKVLAEGFIDRKYKRNGHLTPRDQNGSVLIDPEEASFQAFDLWNEKKAKTADGKVISVEADTLCIHGDNPNVIPILKRIKGAI